MKKFTVKDFTPYIIYLNDNYDEGETEFPEINEKIKGKNGSMVIFQNILNNKTNKLSTHAGLPQKMEKWIINVWIRDTNIDKNFYNVIKIF